MRLIPAIMLMVACHTVPASVKLPELGTSAAQVVSDFGSPKRVVPSAEWADGLPDGCRLSAVERVLEFQITDGQVLRVYFDTGDKVLCSAEVFSIIQH